MDNPSFFKMNQNYKEKKRILNEINTNQLIKIGKNKDKKQKRAKPGG